MGAFYNEIDPFAAAWLRELITAGLIAPGIVDERDIRDIRPDELAGFTQCHFFAGIGVWSYALRNAGWADNRPVWTGSCPCQPFSSAGAGKGFADERHLWPALFHLIEQCEPRVFIGEQVASADGYYWLDLVQADLEGLDYAFGPAVVPAAGYGAPHGRHRMFFVGVADAAGERRNRGEGSAKPARRTGAQVGGAVGSMEHAHLPVSDERAPSGEQSVHIIGDGSFSSLVDATGKQAWVSGLARERRATGGHWADADWIPCRGGKWRPIEPGTFPLAHGAPARMGRLRGYGNAIVSPVATAFIEAALDVIPSFGSPEDNARHFDPAPRELVGTILPLGVVPAFFDGEGQPFDHAPCCLPDAERLTSAGLVSFHEQLNSAGDA